MIRKLPLFLLLATLVVSCGSSALPQSPQVGAAATLESFRAAPGSAPTPNQSYLVKQMQTRIGAALGGVVYELSNGAPYVVSAWERPYQVGSSSAWRIADQAFKYYENRATVTFSGARWDPQHSTMSYGPKQIAQNVQVDNAALTKVIRNDSDATIHVTYTETESLTNSFSSAVTKGLKLDLSATNTTTISGEYAGVKAEDALTISMGVETTSEETQEKAEEGTTEQSLQIEFDAAPGEYYLVTITKEHKVSYQTFSITGVMDFDIHFAMTQHGGRQASRYPGNSVDITGGIAGFEQWIYGYDTTYPKLAGFLDDAYGRTKNGINYVLDPSHRTIEVSGTNQSSLESNADYRVESLGGSLPDDLDHLPVEDADDIGGGS